MIMELNDYNSNIYRISGGGGGGSRDTKFLKMEKRVTLFAAVIFAI